MKFYDIHDTQDSSDFDNTRLIILNFFGNVLDEYKIDEVYIAWIVDLVTFSMNHDNVHYHTVAHLAWCVDFCNKNKIDVNKEVGLAFLFHDAIYIPGNKKNEENSANFAIAIMDKFISKQEGIYLYNYISATSEHLKDTLCAWWDDQGVHKQNVNLLMDIDLAGFAADTEDFDEMNKAIIAEFSDLYEPKALYTGRLDFLNQLDKRTSLYRTDAFKPFESKARANLHAEIKKTAYCLALAHG